MRILLVCCCFYLLQHPFAGPDHPITVAGNAYTVSASLDTVKKKVHYTLKIAGPGITKQKKIDVGPLSDRENMVKQLQAVLHKSALYQIPVPWPAGSDPGKAYRDIDLLVDALVAEQFPLSNVRPVDEQPVNDDNLLKLVQRTDNGRYQLSNITAGADQSLVEFDPNPSPHYKVNWATISANQWLVDNFDQFLQLYFEMPKQTLKPLLYLQFRPATVDYEVIASSDGGHTGAATGLSLSEDVGKKLSGDDVRKLRVNGNLPALSKVVDPYAPKPASNALNLKEQH
jgi:hypothetical protein